VSGTITNGSGVGINGVTVSNGAASTTTNSSGAYTLANLANGTYTITPTLSGYSFSPANRSVTVNGANVTGQNFTGTASSNANPIANFSFTTSNLTATFTDTSTDSDGTIASRSWNFGDSTTSTATNPSKTYTAAGTYNVALTVTDDDGATNTVTKAVTVTAPPTGNVLTKGVPVTGLAATTGNSLNYTMDVPAGATNLTFTMSGGTGDADLYVRFGSAPTDTAYDCRPYSSGNAETCTFAAPSAGTYHVRVKAYSSFSGVSLVGDYTTGGGGGAQTYSNTADYTISDNATVDSPITVSGRSGNAPSSTPVAVNIVHTYIGDLKVDLVAPDGSLYNIHNRTGSSTDNIIKTVNLNLSSEPLNGTWKLRVNDNANQDTGYINSWSITF
jgi:serine protease